MCLTKFNSEWQCLASGRLVHQVASEPSPIGLGCKMCKLPQSFARDLSRPDFAVITDDLDFIKGQLARIPTQKEFARTVDRDHLWRGGAHLLRDRHGSPSVTRWITTRGSRGPMSPIECLAEVGLMRKRLLIGGDGILGALELSAQIARIVVGVGIAGLDGECPLVPYHCLAVLGARLQSQTEPIAGHGRIRILAYRTTEKAVASVNLYSLSSISPKLCKQSKLSGLVCKMLRYNRLAASNRPWRWSMLAS